MTASSLERFLATERRDLLPALEPHRELARSLDVHGQAVLAGWLGVASMLQQVSSDHLGELLGFYQDQAHDYAPMDPDNQRDIVPIYFGATVAGIFDDLHDGIARVAETSSSIGTLHRLLRHHGGSAALLYGSGVLHKVFRDALDAGFGPSDLAPMAGCVVPWQRLVWLVECQLRSGAVLARDRGEPLRDEPDEQLAYLLRLAANQPGLANWPELARFVPRRASGLLPLSHAAYREFRRRGIPDDPQLSDLLVGEIVERRHYVLDGISVVELDELGISRIVLAPEERPESLIAGHDSPFHTAFVIDHEAGSLSGTITLGNSATGDALGRRAVVAIPALADLISEDLVATEAPDREERESGQSALRDAQAAVELLVLSTWRDLVVPLVREEHYEADRVRKPKGKGTRAAKRGNSEVIRYLPRTLVYRRAAKEAVRGGETHPRRIYAVSAFARRLPPGQQRSKDAEAFAREIGIPLAAHQTIVRPHLRGGTDDERRVAIDDDHGLRVRNWRSWSALDILRTRSTSPSD